MKIGERVVFVQPEMGTDLSVWKDATCVVFDTYDAPAALCRAAVGLPSNITLVGLKPFEFELTPNR